MILLLMMDEVYHQPFPNKQLEVIREVVLSKVSKLNNLAGREMKQGSQKIISRASYLSPEKMVEFIVYVVVTQQYHTE